MVDKERGKNISDRERENRKIEAESLQNECYYDCSQQLEDLERENRKIEAMQNDLSMEDMFDIQASMY